MSYEKRGVSASKSEVHEAIKKLDKGLFPNAFCKILPDYTGNDPQYVNLMHADTAGTKTSLAYLYWKETGDLDVWKGIVQDAIVMNLDDMACAGVLDNIILSSTIGRNKGLVTGAVVKELINGAFEFIENMQNLGISIHHAGGETADVGDIVRTADVGFTAFARMPKKDVVNIDIQPGDAIIGFASYGQSTYENEYNSGIGSNGLTFARHETLSYYYSETYPESFDPNLDNDYVYTGNQRLTDEYEGHVVGKLLLSPTRTFVPVIRTILEKYREKIHGIIHNTGGGQTKVLHFMNNLHIIKDNLIEVPPVFRLIQSQNNADWKEMYQVFNMGQRLEVYASKTLAPELISIANSFNIHAQIVGYVVEGTGKRVTLKTDVGEFEY
jgi:phosphoribosylformylglycinamidine cyclo-ligase